MLILTKNSKETHRTQNINQIYAYQLKSIKKLYSANLIDYRNPAIYLNNYL